MRIKLRAICSQITSNKLLQRLDPKVAWLKLIYHIKSVRVLFILCWAIWEIMHFNLNVIITWQRSAINTDIHMLYLNIFWTNLFRKPLIPTKPLIAQTYMYGLYIEHEHMSMVKRLVGLVDGLKTKKKIRKEKKPTTLLSVVFVEWNMI